VRLWRQQHSTILTTFWRIKGGAFKGSEWCTCWVDSNKNMALKLSFWVYNPKWESWGVGRWGVNADLLGRPTKPSSSVLQRSAHSCNLYYPWVVKNHDTYRPGLASSMSVIITLLGSNWVQKGSCKDFPHGFLNNIKAISHTIGRPILTLVPPSLLQIAY
jgi:hypothetical protein